MAWNKVTDVELICDMCKKRVVVEQFNWDLNEFRDYVNRNLFEEGGWAIGSHDGKPFVTCCGECRCKFLDTKVRTFKHNLMCEIWPASLVVHMDFLDTPKAQKGSNDNGTE